MKSGVKTAGGLPGGKFVVSKEGEAYDAQAQPGVRHAESHPRHHHAST